MPPVTYQVKTRVFEGPLDLLLQLITAHQVEITEIDLAGLVTAYLAHLELMERLDLEVTSEFLVIAATLIQLKARRLLPDGRPVDVDDELALTEERDRLLARLLACLTFKDVAALFAHRLAATARLLPRRAGMDPGIVVGPPPVRIPVGPDGLAEIARRVLAAPPDEVDLDHLDLDLPSVAEAMADVRSRVTGRVERDFAELVAHCTRRAEVIAYFLAVLELTRWGAVCVLQEHRDAPIRIRPGAPEAVLPEGREREGGA